MPYTVLTSSSSSACEELVKTVYGKVEKTGVSYALHALEKSLDGKAKPPCKELAVRSRYNGSCEVDTVARVK